MTLSDLSIKNPAFAWVVLAVTIIFGAIAYSSLGVSQLPSADSPSLSISVSWSGAAPEVMEKEVTDVIEEAVMGAEGVEEISSSSSRGSTRVNVQFDLDRDIDAALQDMQSRISAVQRRLPDDVDPPTISKSNPDDMPIMWIALTGDKDRKYLSEYVRDNIKDELSTVPGVSEIFIGGLIDPAMRVWLDPDGMKRYEVTTEDIVSAISQGHRESAAGYIDDGKNETNIRIYAEANDAEELSRIVIPSRASGIVKLADVAETEDGTTDIRRMARTQGINAVGMGIRKQRGVNSVEVANGVKEKMKEISKKLPGGLDFRVRFDSTHFIEESTREMTFVMILSVILTSLVCWWFLGTLSSALSVFLTIPLSIMGTFFFMNMFGFTLNSFTLLALTLVIGIVVDDAIMVIENVSRHKEAGENRVRASFRGSREITFAALAATVAILAIFIPVIFMEGVIGKYFFEFGVTISVAVALSLLGALTITPMMSSNYMKEEKNTGENKHGFMSALAASYSRALSKCLNYRWVVVSAALIFFVLSLTSVRFIKKEIVPAQDQGTISISLQARPGTALGATDKMMAEAEKKLSALDFVEGYFCNFGAGSGNFFVNIKDKKTRPKDRKTGGPMKQEDMIAVMRKTLREIPGVIRVNVQDMSLMGLGGGRSSPVEINIKGPEWEKLASYANDIREKLEASGKMTDADTNYKTGVSELRIIPDRKKAATRGVSMASIGNAVAAWYGGVNAGLFTRGGRRYDIIVQLRLEDRAKIETLKKIMVRNSAGELTPLSAVVTFSEQKTVTSVNRIDRQRTVKVTANVAKGSSQQEAADLAMKIAKETLPEGYFAEAGGATKTFADSFSGLLFALFMGVFVAYMVLAVQFNSFAHPVSVLMALPFAATGALLALLITGNTINFYSMIGILLLMGIVKKNSILLVDFTNARRLQGMGVNEALLSACPVRLRPILMTSVATIAAAIPPALALGPGAETRIPMSITIIGGVLVSTFLTLFVVPCVYSILSRLENVKHMDAVRAAECELKAESIEGESNACDAAVKSSAGKKIKQARKK